jgi:hypothetical protein
MQILEHKLRKVSAGKSCLIKREMRPARNEVTEKRSMHYEGSLSGFTFQTSSG